ncbi:hypothetical protein DFJ58DRAFT_641727, partial [Suillus subalutaceus]|uniref:uncharacterized protein n=1 Tax=Suillus subalutaceus TaxID=48586 RepID=UPI001B876EF1
MLKAAKTYKMSFAPRKLSTHLKQQLPAWFHMGVPPRTYNKLRDTCLQNSHTAKSIKDLQTISKRLTNDPTHHTRSNCACDQCKIDRRDGCKNPHKCANTAANILTKLTPKLNPSHIPPDDNLTLTHQRKEKNERAVNQRNSDIMFDPSVTENLNLTECFRIFTENNTYLQNPAHRHPRP